MSHAAVRGELLTAREAALCLGISTNRLYHHIREGHLRRIRLSPKIVRYDLDDLAEFDASKRGPGRSHLPAHEAALSAAIDLRRTGLGMPDIGRRIGRSTTWVWECLPVGLRGRYDGRQFNRLERWKLHHTVIRLDASRLFDDGPGRSQHELRAPLDDPFEPQRWLEAQLLDNIVGDLSIADIQRMSDDELQPLRERLIAEGFASGRSVQAKERERLRTPARHRGEAPPVTFERMAPRHRGRRAQQELMAGKRTSRKQPKRWNREADTYDWKAAA